MSLVPEIVLIGLVFVCIGYGTAREKIRAIVLGLIIWLIAAYSAHFEKGINYIPPIPTGPEDLVITFIAIMILLILYGGSFLIGFVIGRVVNNVEKYQRA